jgi:hypothetical protein
VFGGSSSPSSPATPRWGVSGSIDRVTGDMKAVSIKMNKKTFISLDVAYFLKCKPAQRMF